MSTATTTERYVQFVTMVATNPELSRQLDAVNDSEDVVKLAAANGYAFTADEIKSAAHESRVQMEQGSDELSEEDLDAVAGGLFGTILHVVRKAIDWLDNKVNGKK